MSHFSASVNKDDVTNNNVTWNQDPDEIGMHTTAATYVTNTNDITTHASPTIIGNKNFDTDAASKRFRRNLNQESDLYRLASSALANMSALPHHLTLSPSAVAARRLNSMHATINKLDNNGSNDNNSGIHISPLSSSQIPPIIPPPQLNSYYPHFHTYSTQHAIQSVSLVHQQQHHQLQHSSQVNNINNNDIYSNNEKNPMPQSFALPEAIDSSSSISNVGNSSPSSVKKRFYSEVEESSPTDNTDNLATETTSTATTFTTNKETATTTSTKPSTLSNRSTRMEKKRKREMQRRSNVNRELESLTSLVIKINPPELQEKTKLQRERENPYCTVNNDITVPKHGNDNTNGCSSHANDTNAVDNKTANSTGCTKDNINEEDYNSSSHPQLNRVELIHLAVTVLDRLHTESIIAKLKIEELNEKLACLKEDNKTVMKQPVRVPVDQDGRNEESMPQENVRVPPSAMPRHLLYGGPPQLVYSAPPYSSYYPSAEQHYRQQHPHHDPHFVYVPDGGGGGGIRNRHPVAQYSDLEALIATKVAEEVAARTADLHKVVVTTTTTTTKAVNGGDNIQHTNHGSDSSRSNSDSNHDEESLTKEQE